MGLYVQTHCDFSKQEFIRRHSLRFLMSLYVHTHCDVSEKWADTYSVIAMLLKSKFIRTDLLCKTTNELIRTDSLRWFSKKRVYKYRLIASCLKNELVHTVSLRLF